MFLVNSRFPLVSAAPSSSGREARHPNEALLLPKLRRYFAEFLNHSSPDRLGILYPPTCVGLGYGHRASSLEAFLGSMGSVTSPEAVRHRISALRPTDLPIGPPTCLPRDNHRPVDLPSCVPPLLPVTKWVGSAEASPLATWIGLGANMVVQEYQPVVHRLRLSASP